MGAHLARLYAAELEGINAKVIEVEVDLNVGLHAFNIVGLADKALNEAKERVNSALKNTNLKPPTRENRKITVNLAPADVKKTGSHYDLAIALGYLLATEQIQKFETSDKIFIGELSLDGRLRPVHGVLNIAQAARDNGFKQVFVPQENASEAAVLEAVAIIPLTTLQDTIDYLEKKKEIARAKFEPKQRAQKHVPDFSEIKSQDNAKRALTIAAAGGHNLLMIGPPGVGKSLLAQAMVGILPDLPIDEAIEITKIYSAAGVSPGYLIQDRPFRSPHHTASLVALVGGGTQPRPGEISLAHRGVLFLDELPEFQKGSLESLRQPIESGVVHVARAKGTLVLPAKFTLVAAMNPCPCGFYGDPEKECRCAAYEVLRYQKKISGPLLDRIDLQITVPRVKIADLRERASVPAASPAVKRDVERVRALERERFKTLSIKTNSEMSSKQTEELIKLDPTAETFLSTLDKTRLSPRGYYRLLKVGQTIADLEESSVVTAAHLAEAFSYRLKEAV